MKAHWKYAPDGGKGIEVNLNDLKNIVNLSTENALNLKTRLGR